MVPPRDTWVFDLSTHNWTNMASTIGRSAPNGRAMASLGGDQALLFGGNDETWVYDLSGNTWTSKVPATAPSARYDYVMASLGGDQRRSCSL